MSSYTTDSHRRADLARPRAWMIPRRDGLDRAAGARGPAAQLLARAFAATLLLTACVLGGLAPAAQAAGGTISGTVRDASGAPLKGMAVAAVGTDRYSPFVTTDATGAYTVSFDAGTWNIYVKDPDGAYAGRAYPDAVLPDQGAPIVLADGAAVTGIDVQLLPGARITGTVRDEAGNPVAKAVSGATVLNTLLGQAETKADGSYVWYGLPAGAWTFSTMPPMGSTLGYQEQVVTLAPGQVAQLDFVLRPKFADAKPAPTKTPVGPTPLGGAVPLTESAPIIVAPLKGRVPVSKAGTLVRNVRCQEKSHCASTVTVTTAAVVRIAKGKPKARLVIAEGVVDATTIESKLTLKITAAGRKLLRKAGKDGLAVKLLSNPTAPNLPASAFKMTLVAG